VDDVLTGQVVDLTHEGHAVVKIDRYPIFIPNALIDVISPTYKKVRT
jgi:23S rRNA (uracil1939-C5)-methyltransferase